MPKVYSPSQTVIFSECPFKWYTQCVLRYSHESGQTEPQRLGQAVASAMEYFNNVWKDSGVKPSGPDVIAAALSKAEIPELVDSPAYNAMRKVLTKHLSTEPTPDSWLPIAVETPRPDHGHCRADVVYQTPSGRVVRDYKYTTSCESRYVVGRLQGYGDHPQRYHYAWSEDASLFQIVLISGQPVKVHEQVWSCDPADVTRWLTSQRGKWAVMEQMERGEIAPWLSDLHSTKYGPCSLYDWCQNHKGDHTLLPMLGYVQRPKSDATTSL